MVNWQRLDLPPELGRSPAGVRADRQGIGRDLHGNTATEDRQSPRQGELVLRGR